MKSRIKGRRGQLAAGIFGGGLLAITTCVCVSIFSAGSEFDRMFAGGLLFGPLWVGVLLLAYYASSTLKAWAMMVLPSLVFIAIDAYGLMGNV